MAKGFRKKYLWGYLFIAPPVLGVLLFQMFPLLYSIYISMSKYDGNNPPVFSGIENYTRLLFHDPMIWKTLFNTFYAALGIPIGMTLSLLIAMLLNQDIKGRNVFRIFFFMPTICSIVAITLIWKWVFNTDFGLLNYFLGFFGVQPVEWLGSETWAMPAMIIQGVWGGMGVSILMYMASLKGVPSVYYEAATVDGANRRQKFIHITLPGISPVTFFIFVTSLIGALQDFVRFQIMTNGGPNFSTTTIVQYIYSNAFNYTDMGYASAIAWLLGIIIMIITVTNFSLSRKWVHYE